MFTSSDMEKDKRLVTEWYQALPKLNLLFNIFVFLLFLVNFFVLNLFISLVSSDTRSLVTPRELCAY